MGVRVGDGFVFGVGGVEFDGGEVLNFIGNVVGSGINFGNDNFVFEFVFGVEVGEFVVFGSKGFVVIVLWGVEFD